MTLPLMPKATAVWLVENTALTFQQIADFCGLHELEVQAIADGEVAAGMQGWDPVGNGQLTREEMRAGREHRGGRHGRGGGMHQLTRADANNDGNITRDEFLTRPLAHFGRLDANSDGVIQASERPQRPERGERPDRRERGERPERPNFDANNDRQVSRAEFDAMGASMFQRLDANSDGRVTQEEAQAARPPHRGRG